MEDVEEGETVIYRNMSISGKLGGGGIEVVVKL